MLDLLIKLLTPVFVGMGASASDVSTYVGLVGTYIYVILGTLLVMIAVMVAAHFVVKKGTRHVVRWSAGIAWLLVVVLCVNLICFFPLKNMLSGVLNASKAEISDDVTGNSKSVIKEVGEEGMVLVKNNGLLPLSSSVSSLNVFGWASAFPVYSGTGSAASGEAGPAVSILQSLNDAGYETNQELTTMYEKYWTEYGLNGRPDITMQDQNWTLPEPTKAYYTADLMKNAAAFSDTAVIVIARSGGENADLPTDMYSVIHHSFNVADTNLVPEAQKANYGYTNASYQNNDLTGGYDDFDKGEHYLQLSNTEEALVETVCSQFDKVIVVINANNAMELDWVDKYDQIGAVILAPGTGNTGMAALGEIISGAVNPSGRTADTYLKDLTAAPTFNHSGNSGNYFYNDVADEQKQIGRTDSSFQGVISFVNYVEGIYMGYKFYETASDDKVINYSDYVQYPFGYGLSYTTFEQHITDFKQNDTTLTVSVSVKNTGSVAGKDVVELYYTPPYYDGGIEKASVNLLDFAKTGLLDPGASQTVTFSVPLEDMASYDSSCIKTKNGGYILEKGEYKISIRSDSHTVLEERSFELSADKDYSANGRASDNTAAVNLFGYAEPTHTVLSRKGGFANYAAATAVPAEKEYQLGRDGRKLVKAWSVFGYKIKDHEDPDAVMPTTGASNGLKLSDLTGKGYDDPDWEKLLDQMSVQDMVTLVNVGGWQTAEISSVGKIATSDCDGPAGLSNYVTGSNGTQFTTEVLMAQTWSKEIADKVGDAMGQEFANASNFGWYGPAMNLHRSAFSGRNFEYYSEDGVLSGKFASAQVNSAAKYGVYAYIKHFAANDQETNRCAFLLTWLPEQTLRENVLKPFETVVKNFDFNRYVMGVMSSYNWLGTVPACESYELLTSVLRDEWGFKGMVITDYNGSYGYQTTEGCIRAGNDLMLAYGNMESNKVDTSNATTVQALRKACKNILYTVGNSGYYEDPDAVNQGGMNGMTRLFLIVDIVSGVVLLGAEALVVLRWLKKKKSASAE